MPSKNKGKTPFWYALPLLAVFAVNGSSQAVFAASSITPAASSAYADLQFFGDLYLSPASIKATATTVADAKVFAGVQLLLDSAYYNVVNFEGTVTAAKVPFVQKSYLLRMPASAPQIMRAVQIHAVSMANNHTMDFGRIGLADSVGGLNAAGIQTFGAGQNLREALRPLTVDLPTGSACLLSFTRTLPAEFFARPKRAGTAFVDDAAAAAAVAACAKAHKYVLVLVHWGQELSHKVQPYQTLLARAVIKAGATAVIGHHPHVLQKFELIEDKPVFYSLGNFVFGTVPLIGEQQGAGVRFKFLDRGRIDYEIVPLVVHHGEVGFVPRPLAPGEADPFEALMPAKHKCQWSKDAARWSCRA